jgi:hypothetical protein
MTETPPYRRLGAEPESPAPKGRRLALDVSADTHIPHILDKPDN